MALGLGHESSPMNVRNAFTITIVSFIKDQKVMRIAELMFVASTLCTQITQSYLATK